MSGTHGTLTIDGKEYVVVPVDEYERLRDTQYPDLPAADQQGRRDAHGAIRAGIGRSVVRRRVAAGLSQKDLAEQAGVSVETLSRIERGRHRPQPATLEKLEQVLPTQGSPNSSKPAKSAGKLNKGYPANPPRSTHE
jgi:ribosome-binding protein aMBF1 (putative translation factor)